MKAFVATKETQGKRKNDFCFVEEKEMVWFGGCLIECYALHLTSSGAPHYVPFQRGAQPESARDR